MSRLVRPDLHLSIYTCIEGSDQSQIFNPFNEGTGIIAYKGTNILDFCELFRLAPKKGFSNICSSFQLYVTPSLLLHTIC